MASGRCALCAHRAASPQAGCVARCAAMRRGRGASGGPAGPPRPRPPACRTPAHEHQARAQDARVLQARMGTTRVLPPRSSATSRRPCRVCGMAPSRGGIHRADRAACIAARRTRYHLPHARQVPLATYLRSGVPGLPPGYTTPPGYAVHLVPAAEHTLQSRVCSSAPPGSGWLGELRRA